MALDAWIDVGRDASVGATNTPAAALGITPERDLRGSASHERGG
jgi:hypothetical protein